MSAPRSNIWNPLDPDYVEPSDADDVDLADDAADLINGYINKYGDAE